MSNWGYCSIVIKNKRAAHELMDILTRNIHISGNDYVFPLWCKYDNSEHGYVVESRLKEVKFEPTHVRFEFKTYGFDTIGYYLTYRGIKFLYQYVDEYNCFSGYTNDTNGEFFKGKAEIFFGESQKSITVALPLDASREQIAAIKDEAAKKENDEICWTEEILYCSEQEFYKLNDEERAQFEEQFKVLTKGVELCTDEELNECEPTKNVDTTPQPHQDKNLPF